MTRDQIAIKLISLGKDYPINHKIYNSVMQFFSSRGDIIAESLFYDSIIDCLIIRTNCIVLCVENDGYIHS